MIVMLTLTRRDGYTMAKYKRNAQTHARKRRVDKTPVKFKDLPVEKQRKQIILIALVIILFVASVVIYRTEMLSYIFKDRVRFVDGALKDVEVNDFVINRASSKYGEDGEYYVIGSLDIPEGYKEYREFLSQNDAYKQDFSYIVEQKEGYTEQLVLMSCTKNWDELIQNVVGVNAGEDSTIIYSDQYDLLSAEKGNPYHGAIQRYTTRSEDNGYYMLYAYAYVETGADDACVMIQNSYKTAYKKDQPSNEDVLKKLDMYVDMVNALN